MSTGTPRQRKTAGPSDTQTELAASSRSSERSALTTGLILYYVLLATMLSISLSYMFTNTWSWGYKVPSWRKFLPRNELKLTPEELAKHDGSDPNLPVYLAIKYRINIDYYGIFFSGNVYDVSARRDVYGPGGSYHFFAGRESARAYITGCFKDHLTHDLRGLDEKQLKDLEGWIQFYENHDSYTYVGKVMHPPIDPKSPIPKDCNEPTGKKP